MKQIVILSALLIFILQFFIHAELKLPSEPVAPSIAEPPSDVTLASSKKTYPYKVSVIMGNGKTNVYTISLPDNEMTFISEKNGGNSKDTISFTNLLKVDFLRWKGYSQKDGSTIFYPIKTRITLKDDSYFDCAYYIEELGKIPSKTWKGESTLYSYFYEYRVKGIWKNSGRKELSYPETHPPAQCLKSILFYQ